MPQNVNYIAILVSQKPRDTAELLPRSCPLFNRNAIPLQAPNAARFVLYHTILCLPSGYSRVVPHNLVSFFRI